MVETGDGAPFMHGYLPNFGSFSLT